jgi:hypothetical protein
MYVYNWAYPAMSKIPKQLPTCLEIAGTNHRRSWHGLTNPLFSNFLFANLFSIKYNTYILSSPVCQTCLIDLYRKMTEQFRPELFDDSDIVVYINNSSSSLVTENHQRTDVYFPAFIQKTRYLKTELS